MQLANQATIRNTNMDFDPVLTQQVMKSRDTDFDTLQQAKVLEYACCLECREEYKVSRITIVLGPEKGQVVEQKTGCYCEFLDETKANQQKARAARLQSIFEENSLINPDLLNATFNNFEPGEFSQALEKAKSFAESFDIRNPRNLFFQGSFGTGKSHLSVAVTKTVTEKGYSTIFISTPKLLTKIRSTYNKTSHQTEDQIISAITNADLVVFDDIGAEGESSGWALQKLFEVVDQRIGKHNVFTTNLSSRDFEASRDLQRIFSRMMMNAEPIVMNGTDYRRKQFAKNL